VSFNYTYIYNYETLSHHNKIKSGEKEEEANSRIYDSDSGLGLDSSHLSPINPIGSYQAADKNN